MRVDLAVRRTFAMLAMSCVAANSTLGQTVTTSTPLVAGDFIITMGAPHLVRSGEFVRFTADTLVLAHYTPTPGGRITRTDTLRLPLRMLDSISVRRKSERAGRLGAAGEGVLVGGFFGGIVGGLSGGGIGAASNRLSTREGAQKGALWGVGLGALLGFVSGVIQTAPGDYGVSWQRVRWTISEPAAASAD